MYLLQYFCSLDPLKVFHKRSDFLLDLAILKFEGSAQIWFCCITLTKFRRRAHLYNFWELKSYGQAIYVLLINVDGWKSNSLHIYFLHCHTESSSQCTWWKFSIRLIQVSKRFSMVGHQNFAKFNLIVNWLGVTYTFLFLINTNMLHLN